MEGLPACANCLSIARDAKTMGIDVDGPQNDKGLYGLIPIHQVSSISNDYIIHWRAFSDNFAQNRVCQVICVNDLGLLLVLILV
jgi:hypothetical protein